MERFGIKSNIKNAPILDPSFFPINAFNRSFLATAKTPIGIAVERADGNIATINTFIGENKEANNYFVNRLVKTLLWMKGGYKVYCTNNEIYDYLKNIAYCENGTESFDYHYFSKIFEHPFEVLLVDKLPEPKDSPKPMGGHLDGCRIGFDAGGSDRKVSAVIDGEPVFQEEVVWFPKTNSDPKYHYNGIVSAFKTAASHLPRVDAVGISSAGVYINDRAMSASLFIKIPDEIYEKEVKDIYIRAVKDTFGDIPFSVVNDGDVTALAGAISLNCNNILGIAMGTSEAGGFVDKNGCITGWLNELAFVPVDVNPNAVVDEWSLDIGCGAKYFSQDAVIKLAPAAGIELDDNLSPAEKLKVVQGLMENNDKRAANIYLSIGCYLAHALAHYHDLYNFDHVLLLGRVMSGKGGDLLLDECTRVLGEDYPDLNIKIDLPDEKFRRVGQSAAAASLPKI